VSVPYPQPHVWIDPNHQAVPQSYASAGARFVAWCIDACVLAAPLGVAFGWDTQWTTFHLPSIVVGLLYSALLESSTWQATLGQRALGLRVTDEAGARISFGRAAGRHLASYLSYMLLGIGILMILFTDRKQALHDRLAGTLVLRGAPN